ncbi:hypothetical protein LCL97_07920 [Seohaeicola saemankumensis]|nr:hypothetical protein [Seohaeicola saemankumensis]MCA0870746.1 hypothetical protein [Seohaeicola saemankumensis]
MRILIHAGFHKTGTTTVQQALRHNRAALKPHLRFLLRPAMVAACDSARAWSARRDPLDLALFRYELAQLAESWDPTDPRPLLLSSEDLAGHMPGRHGLTTYDATPQLMQVLADTLTAARPEADLSFYFSTRGAANWLASCHAQHLAASRMTLSAADYATRYASSAGLDAVIDAVARAVAPHPVHRTPLEASRTRPLGPLDPLIDLIGLPAEPRATLILPPPANTRPSPARLDALLQLNRGPLPDRALRAAKKSLPPDTAT